MASFRFIGDPRHGGEGPDDITLLGYRFGRLHATEVTDARAITKLAGNPHFARVGADASSADTPSAAAASAAAASAAGAPPPRATRAAPAAKQARKRQARRAAEGAA